jgi:hypothetical protein
MFPLRLTQKEVKMRLFKFVISVAALLAGLISAAIAQENFVSVLS